MAETLDGLAASVRNPRPEMSEEEIAALHKACVESWGEHVTPLSDGHTVRVIELDTDVAVHRPLDDRVVSRNIESGVYTLILLRPFIGEFITDIPDIAGVMAICRGGTELIQGEELEEDESPTETFGPFLFFEPGSAVMASDLLCWLSIQDARGRGGTAAAQKMVDYWHTEPFTVTEGGYDFHKPSPTAARRRDLWSKTGKAVHLTPEVKTRKLATSLAVKLLPSIGREGIEEVRRAEDPDNDKITRIYADLPEGVTMGRPVTESDATAMNAIASFMDAGVNCVSAPQFCRFVNGTNGRPRKETVERAIDTMRRLFITPVKIVATEELRGSGEPIDADHKVTVETTAVKGEIITDEASNGQSVVMFRFDEMPAIWQLAYGHGQVTSIPQRSFRRIMYGLQSTERNVNLADYLTRRVAEIGKHRAYMSHKMRYDTIFAEVTPTGGKQWGELSRKSQKAFRDSVTHIMDGLQAEGRFYRWFEYQNTGEGRDESKRLTTTHKTEKSFTDGKKKSETRPWYQTERIPKYARAKADGIEIWPRAPKNGKKLEKAES